MAHKYTTGCMILSCSGTEIIITIIRLFL